MLWIEPALKGGANVVINLSGDNARIMQAFGDKQMVDQVLIRLHAFYPQARGAFTGYEIRRYSTDPSTGGAYLAFGPGQISKYWRLWERPLQRVAFAGEHTDALYPGTLEGALRSGQRAASQVQDLAAGKSFEPAKVVPVAAAAAVAAKAGQGNFFSSMFGGSSDKAADKKPEPAKVEAKAEESRPGFFSRMFGGAQKVAAKPIEPIAPVAPVPAPEPVAAPAPVEPPKPAVPVQAEPVKKAPAKAAVKKPVAKKAPVKPVAKKAPAKVEPAKKPVAATPVVTDAKVQ
jgi:monoamine oxidase